MKNETLSAIAFLKLFRPNETWLLTAITPDGPIETKAFDPTDEKGVGKWIEARNGKKNLYFHVNPVKPETVGKATKEDVQRVEYLHVDIDAEAGKPFDEELARIKALLDTSKIEPTTIIYSGGGYQAYFKLDPNPVLVTEGSVDKAQELESYNRQLEIIYGADHCHNIDRIMRLPGTWNLPNKLKAAKGRKKTLAELSYWSGRSYPIGLFTPAVKVQTAHSLLSLSDSPKVIISGNIPDMGVDELVKWAKDNGKVVDDTTLAMIACGTDPTEPEKYKSRSEALFRVCCGLVRCEIDDEIIYAVITGSNTIGDSVREKRNWEGYALRQIERAKEEAVDPMLRVLNEKHAVIGDINGKCRIISETTDNVLSRTRISMQSFDDFRNRYSNVKVTVGYNEKGNAVEKPAGSWWTSHKMRRQYETIVFAPGRDIKDAYNLWTGFACDAIPGDKHRPFLDFIFETVCKKNTEYYGYLIGWMANCVQHPDSPGEVAIVLKGNRGTGKSFTATVLGALFGRHFLQVADSKHLVGSFNAHLRDVVVLFGDEAFFAGDKKHESVLKTIVTEEHLVIEGKGVDAQAAPNYVHLLLASNEDWVVPAGVDERRFFVLEVGDHHQQDHKYFGEMSDVMKKDGGNENLLHYLLTYDLSNYNVRGVPKTKALQDQKIYSMTPEQMWMFHKLWEGRLFRNDSYWRMRIIKGLLYDDYLKSMQALNKQFRFTDHVFGKFLSKAFPLDYPRNRPQFIREEVINDDGMPEMKSRKVPAVELCSLAEVRAHWDEKFGGPFDWPDITDDYEEEDEPRQTSAPF